MAFIDCAICYKKFHIYPYQVGLTKTCNKECGYIYSSLLRKSKPKIRVQIPCVICGNNFSVVPCRANKLKTCSKLCSSKHRAIIGKKYHHVLGKINCVICNKEFAISPSRKGVLKTCSKICRYKYRAIWFRNNKPTSIEKKLYKELKRRGLLFEKQYLVNGRFLVDAYIPSLNLIIEADGDYWHSLPKVKVNDKYKNTCLLDWNYKLLRLTETEINNGSFKNKLN